MSPRQPGAERLGGGGRFAVIGIPADPPLVVKAGDAGALRREARGLALAAPAGLAPRLVCAGDGVLVQERLPGAPRDLAGLGRADARRLGALVRRVHDLRHGARGGLDRWGARVRSLAAYRRSRARDALERCRPEEAALGRAVAVAGAAEAGRGELPFRALHGDLVAENVVWTPDGPRLVDWEFWRMGDPAEDLAYLCELNGLGGRVAGWVLDGYGDPTMADRLDSWRALAALDAGLWYREAGHPAAGALIARAAALAGPDGAP